MRTKSYNLSRTQSHSNVGLLDCDDSLEGLLDCDDSHAKGELVSRLLSDDICDRGLGKILPLIVEYLGKVDFHRGS